MQHKLSFLTVNEMRKVLPNAGADRINKIDTRVRDQLTALNFQLIPQGEVLQRDIAPTFLLRGGGVHDWYVSGPALMV